MKWVRRHIVSRRESSEDLVAIAKAMVDACRARVHPCARWPQPKVVVVHLGVGVIGGCGHDVVHVLGKGAFAVRRDLVIEKRSALPGFRVGSPRIVELDPLWRRTGKNQIVESREIGKSLAT